MFNQLNVWFFAGGIVGWIASRLLGPTADALGAKILDLLSTLVKRRSIAQKLYLELEALVKENHKINGHRRFSARKTYLRDQSIISFLLSHGTFSRRAIKDVWIEMSQIDSYDESNIFFAGMELLMDELRKRDIQKIYGKYCTNNQAALWPFLELVEDRSPKFLSEEARNYLRTKQKEWQEQTEVKA